jgi:hypothetical protein
MKRPLAVWSAASGLKILEVNTTQPRYSLFQQRLTLLWSQKTRFHNQAVSRCAAW